MDDLEDLLLPPMGEALLESNDDTVYREAHRQYALLYGRRQSALSVETGFARNDSLDINLARYYQRRFDDATYALDEWEKHKLLTICFAYKTRARVLHYLKLLEGSHWTWVTLFTDLVEAYGIDSAFLESSTATPTPGANCGQETATQQKALVDGAALETATYTTESSQPQLYFIIPTLPLAFPTRFFAALVQLAPIQQLSVSSILSYPAALQMALYDPLKVYVGSNVPTCWSHKVSSNATDRHPEARSWVTFLDHLLDDHEMLWPVSTRRLNQHRINGDFVEAGQGDGYEEEDLEIWLAGWIADRQSVGLKEKGQETLLQIQRRISQAGIDDEKEKEQAYEDSVKDIDDDENVAIARTKRVSWSEQLEIVKEIPQREPYDVHPSPGKGLGAFASHTLVPGEIILREAPILKIKPTKVSKGSPYPLAEIGKLVNAEYERLSEKEKHDVLNLSLFATPEEWSEDIDILAFIFRTNAYDTGSSVGLFPKIARINHSCRPNAAYYWNEALGKRIITATRRIEEGEEIFVSFISLLMGREERQKKLDRYGFKCTCEACAQEQHEREVSDKRREDIRKGFQAFSSQLNLSIPEHPSAVRKARKNAAASLQLAKMVQEEELADYYASVFKIVAISHARVQDWEKATVWANKGYELKVREDSTSAATMEMHELTSRFVENWKAQLHAT